jgi:glycerate dehydrogenase
MSEQSSLAAVFLDADTVNPDELDMGVLENVVASLTLYGKTPGDQLMERTEGAQCVIVNKVQLDRHFFEARPGVRLVCITATGTNNVDLVAAEEHGVAVVNCRGYSTGSVAQHTLMLLLMLLRSESSYDRQVNEGDWSRSKIFCLLNDPIRETGELTLGIVGYGDIGQEVQRLGEAFGMRTIISERIGVEPREGRVAFEQVVAQSDILTLHCPLTEQTRALINADRLSAMKPGAMLVNTARGELIDEVALKNALLDGALGGAALDVLSQEPPPHDHPLLAVDLPNLIVTPHTAWASRKARQGAVQQTAENIRAWLDGQTLRRVV